MLPEGPLQYLQEPTMGRYGDSSESNLRPYFLFILKILFFWEPG
jgi:hypothetical protein